MMIGVSILKSFSCTKISRRSQCISLLNSFLGRFCKLLSLSDFTSNFRSNALASSTLVLGSCYYLLNIFWNGILLHLFTLIHVIPCHQSHPNEWNHPSMKGMPPDLIHLPEKDAPFVYIHFNGWMPHTSHTLLKRMHHSCLHSKPFIPELSLSASASPSHVLFDVKMLITLTLNFFQQLKPYRKKNESSGLVRLKLSGQCSYKIPSK